MNLLLRYLGCRFQLIMQAGQSLRFLLLLLMHIDALANPISPQIPSVLRRHGVDLQYSKLSSSHQGQLLQREWVSPIQPSAGFEELGDGWNALSQEYQAIVPSELAADALADFYHSIISICTAMIAQNAPPLLRGGTFAIGEFEFRFDGLGSSISWSLIRAFADFMLLTTDRGFTNTYTIWMTHLASAQVIKFIMRLNPEGVGLG